MNIAIVNPYASAGNALQKWQKVKPFLNNGIYPLILNKNNGINEIVKDFLQEGNTNFIAAGGDGTINLVLNKLINSLNPDALKKIKLGAIGIGSSNDFHKPFNEREMLDGIPAKINFETAEPRDVGCISYWDEGIRIRKYFLINASIGITAEANSFFNKTGKVLSLLKRNNTNLSILYSVFRTILNYQSFKIKIQSNETDEFEINLTNLGIIKNPNFSGNLRYSSEASYSNGKFDIHLCNDMSKKEITHLLYFLSRGKFDRVNKKRSWRTNELNVSCENPFLVEYDGEIIKTKSVVFTVLPKLIKVCSC